ncbi:MAG: S1/P1 nuclease [Pyrinomonadaceae bacterium]
MLRRTAIIFLFAAILCGANISAYAWDETGHKISAYIAWHQMTPDVRERVVKILLDSPEDSQIATFYLSYGSRREEVRKREFFMLMATWSDIVRDRSFDTRYKKYHHGNWHYSDWFWTQKDGRIEYLAPPDDGGMAVDKITEFDRLIRGGATNSEKAVAIAWLEHLIGDIHQPLHTSARVTDLEPKGDQGGNLFLLTPKDTPRERQKNLHSYWDSIIVYNSPNKKSECDAEYIDPLANSIIKDFPYRKMQDKIAPGRYEEWAKDSLTFAQNDVFSSDLKRFEMPSDKYKKKAVKIAEERLAIAGYRMGDLFNRVFGSSATTTSPK